MTHYVYIVECADYTLYTGMTSDLKKRIQAHNSSKSGAHYTKTRRPVRLVYSEECEDKEAALRREYQVKQLSRAKKIALYKKKSVTKKAKK